MIVISAGMQRSGTRWYYNLTHDLAVLGGFHDSRKAREDYGLQSILLPPNPHLARLHAWKLRKLDKVGNQGVNMIIKTHRGSTRFARKLIQTGRFKSVYICRDIRDVILSGLDRGKLLRDSGKAIRFYKIGPYRTFARLKTIEGATLWAKYQLIPRWKSWIECEDTLITRYEDLCAHPRCELRRFANHLNLSVTNEQIDEVIAMHAPTGSGRGSNSFVKGVIGRYKDAMTPEQQELCIRRLGGYLRRMGYLSDPL